MKKELVIIYDTPSTTYTHQIRAHNLVYYLKFFDKIHILYWSKENLPDVFEKEDSKFIFYPYCKPYNSGYLTGLKYMIWIGKTLWQICKNAPKDTKLILMPVIPIWAGLPTLIVGKLKREKVVLRLEAQKIEYTEKEGKLAGVSKIPLFVKLLILKLIYYLTLPLYDSVIGISEGVSEEAKKYGAKKVITIPIRINIEPFLFKVEGKTKSKEKPTILYVGQIKKIKGIDNLTKSFRFIKREKNFLAKLLIVGEATNPKDEPFFQELKQLSKGLDIEFLGWISHEKLPEIYKRADIFVFPSLSDALGIVIMEAMASELPVIATKTSGANYLVKDEKTGFLVPIGDPVAIKEKIKLLLENPDLKKSMGQAGRERIKEIMKTVDENNEKLWKIL